MAEGTNQAGKVAKKEPKELTKKEAAKATRKETPKKDVAKKEASKVNRVEDIKRFFAGARSELKKVHWPERRQVLVYTSVVLVTVVIMAAYIWVADLGLGKLLQLLVGK